MEDENLTTSTPVEGDVVQVSENNFTPAPEPNTPPMEPSSDTIPQTTGEPEYERLNPQPQTEKTLAEQYVDDARADAYLSKGHGLSDWIKNTYDYDQQQAGTMWVAGKINDVATQMSFLEATLNEDMYNELDLQKYFFDTNLATARAYAKEKRHETAYGYYRAAQEKALSEGQLTGWYMPAEANYMLSQWAVANANLEDPNLNTMDRNRAGSVKQAVESWFNSNNITWRGIECLNNMYYKETVRHNKEQERLQRQANEIAAAQNKANQAAAASGYNLQLRQFEFQNAQMELQWGLDLNQNGVIGHSNWDVVDGTWTGDADNFGWYPTQKLWAQHNLDAAFKLWGTEEMKTILGNDYWDSYNIYRGAIDAQRYADIYTANGGSNLVTKDNMNTFGNLKIKPNQEIWIADAGSDVTEQIKITSKDNQIYCSYNKDGSVRLYVFDSNGVAHQIIRSDIELLGNSKSLDTILKEQSTSLYTGTDPIKIMDDKGNEVTLQIGNKNMSYYGGSFADMKDPKKYGPIGNGITEKEQQQIKEAQKKGYSLVPGAVSTQGIDSSWVMEKDGEYYEVNGDGLKKIKVGQTSMMTIDPDTGKVTLTHADGSEIKNWWMKNMNSATQSGLAENQFERIGYNKSGDPVYRYVNPDGSVVYISQKGVGTLGNAEWEKPEYNIISEEQVIKQKILKKDQIDTFNESTFNYIHKVNINEVEQNIVPSSEEIINENSKTMSKKAKQNAESKVSQHYSSSSSSGGSATPREISDPEYNWYKDEKSGLELNKEQYDVLEDSQKLEVAEAQLGKIAKEQIKENQKRYEQLFGKDIVAQYLKGGN